MERTRLDPISAAYYLVANNSVNVNVIKGGDVIVVIDDGDQQYVCACSLTDWRKALASVISAI